MKRRMGESTSRNAFARRAPARVLAVKQPHVPVGIALAVLEPPTQKAVAARNSVDEAARRLELRDDSLAQLGAQAFVGINAQYPLVARSVDGELLLRAEPEPFFPDDASAVTGRELDRVVRRARVHHDDLLGKGDTRKAALQLAGGVAGDDRYGQGHGRVGRDGKPV